MLSYKRYAWLCVLGAEVAYVVCLLGAYLPLRTERAELLHRTLLETLPGFAWGSPLGFLAGAFDIFVVAWVFGAYFVWMHNTSLIHSDETSDHRESLPEKNPRLAHCYCWGASVDLPESILRPKIDTNSGKQVLKSLGCVFKDY